MKVARSARWKNSRWLKHCPYWMYVQVCLREHTVVDHDCLGGRLWGPHRYWYNYIYIGCVPVLSVGYFAFGRNLLSVALQVPAKRAKWPWQIGDRLWWFHFPPKLHELALYNSSAGLDLTFWTEWRNITTMPVILKRILEPDAKALSLSTGVTVTLALVP